MDEYTSEIAMGGHNTLVIHNTCEDSLLASPLILDLVILGELCSRIKVVYLVLHQFNGHTINLSFPYLTHISQACFFSNRFIFHIFIQIKRNEPDAEFVTFRSVLSLLSYLCKAPLVPAGTPVVNSLFRQRAAIENILRACVGLPPISNLSLEHRVSITFIRIFNHLLMDILFYIFFSSLICQLEVSHPARKPKPQMGSPQMATIKLDHYMVRYMCQL